MKKILFIASAAAIIASSLSACSSQYQLTPAAQNVQFVDVKPTGDCKFLGQVEGRRGTFFSGTKTHSELIRDAATDLLNQAATIGGNVIYNAQDATMRYVSEVVPTDVIMTGEVYQCN